MKIKMEKTSEHIYPSPSGDKYIVSEYMEKEGKSAFHLSYDDSDHKNILLSNLIVDNNVRKEEIGDATIVFAIEEAKKICNGHGMVRVEVESSSWIKELFMLRGFFQYRFHKWYTDMCLYIHEKKV